MMETESIVYSCSLLLLNFVINSTSYTTGEMLREEVAKI